MKPTLDKHSPNTSRSEQTQIRLRALQAGLAAAALEVMPYGREAAGLAGVDPVLHAQRCLMRDLGAAYEPALRSPASRAPISAKGIARALVIAVKRGLPGSQIARMVGRRGLPIALAACALYAGATAYVSTHELGRSCVLKRQATTKDSEITN